MSVQYPLMHQFASTIHSIFSLNPCLCSMYSRISWFLWGVWSPTMNSVLAECHGYSSAMDKACRSHRLVVPMIEAQLLLPNLLWMYIHTLPLPLPCKAVTTTSVQPYTTIVAFSECMSASDYICLLRWEL